jgi:SAM-dependent methyltransferase
MSTLKILAVIANYGTKNDSYLHRVLDEYRSFAHDTHVIVLTNVPKQLGPDVEVIHIKPTGDPWTFPFAHKAILAERVKEYDLFIYSEDDTLITIENIDAFLNATSVLHDDEVTGFMRVESTDNGSRSISTINSHFRWDPLSVVRRGRYTFAYFSNEHAACYVLTRKQLQAAIASGGFLVTPHESKYDLLVTAATDPYTQCGLRKLICISHIESFLIAHLPNKYIGHFGVDHNALERQTCALMEIAAGVRRPTVLLQTESKLPRMQWSKCFYERPRQELMAAVPGTVQTLLSFGCGNGLPEREFARRGIKVTAIPLDSVVGACVEKSGVEVIYGDVEGVLRALSGRRFDVIVMTDLLHLLPDPANLLQSLSSLLNNNGSLVVSAPNMRAARILWKRLKQDRSVENLGNYHRSGVRIISYETVAKTCRSAGLVITNVTPIIPDNGRWIYRSGGPLLPRLLATDFVFTLRLPNTSLRNALRPVHSGSLVQ